MVVLELALTNGEIPLLTLWLAWVMQVTRGHWAL